MHHDWTVGVLVPLLAFGPGGSGSAGRDNPLLQAGFVVGTWAGTFKAYPTPRQPSAFEAPATMTARWGPQMAWVDTEATTRIPGIGSYVARVIVRYDAASETFDAYVVNTFGNAGRYSGTMTDRRLIFLGKVGDVTQRVTYESISEREMRFLVEESDDGVSFRPHSEVLWHREG